VNFFVAGMKDMCSGPGDSAYDWVEFAGKLNKYFILRINTMEGMPYIVKLLQEGKNKGHC
jgi:hypothetical protein